MQALESLRDSFWTGEPISAFDMTFLTSNVKHVFSDYTGNMVISIAIGLVTLLLIMYYIFSTKKAKIPFVSRGPPKPRFRKRERFMFYTQKLMRKVKGFTKIVRADVTSSGRLRSRKKLFIKLARKLLLKKEQSAVRLPKEPPHFFLEADLPDLEREQRLPPEVLYMIKSVRVFGHLEKPLFLELCKYMETKHVPTGKHLFRVGDIDDSIFVLQSGKLNVFVRDIDGTDILVKQVNQGDHIHSLLSVIDVLTGNPQPYKTVSAVAVEDSTVLRLPVEAFQSVLEKFPETLVRVVQIIMVRLQRVTFMAMHNYLGLSYELINPASLSDKKFSVHSLQRGSPSRHTKSGIPRAASSSDVETIQKVMDYGNQENSDIEHVEEKRKAFLSGKGKSQSIPVGSQLSVFEEGVRKASDFQAACSRARVDSLPDRDPIAVGSPPVKSSMEEVIQSSGLKNKQAGISDVNISASQSHMDDDYVLRLATKDISHLFGLEDESLLAGLLSLRRVLAGTTLCTQGDQDASLIFVVAGSLQVLQQVVGKETEERSLFVVHPGDIVGTLAVLTGEPSFFTIRAKSNAWIVTVSKQNFYTLMACQPHIVLHVAMLIVRRMSPFVRQIDFALDWAQVEAGKSLFRQGEKSECIYIVLNGRLRSVVTVLGGKKELVGEYGRGELVGLVEVLTQTERATTVMAVRDTELAVLPEELLNMIKRRYPQIVTRLIHLLGQRILGTLQNQNQASLSEHPKVDQRPAVANLATVAILSVTDDVPLFNFTLELQYALNPIGPTLRLTSDIIEKRLGPSALDSVNEYRLLSWLGQQEDLHRIVLYQCNRKMTAWTKHCIRQADCILIVALASKDPTVGKLEQQMENIAVRAQKELILLHQEDGPRPHNTVEWLNARGWCSSHHHIRCSKRVFSRKNKSAVLEYYRKLFQTTEPDRLSDFSRLARVLTGTAIGLVLGGGGARGASHVGIIRCLQEAGIPIDMVGGTSIGSFIGGLWCEELSITPFIQRAREWCMEMTSLWDKILDLTYPVSAMFSGKGFNRSIEKVFKNRQIEDLWLPYFCITTDISASQMRVHTNGSLWRYVRASMSLSGYLPPLCDPVDGHLLLDGGYVNNLPADVMKAMGAQNIFAIDVGSTDESNLTNYGDQLSGWWLLWKKWVPWVGRVKVPNLAEIQSRLAYVSCVRQLEVVKESSYCEYVRPPIDKYTTLQFGAFDEINDVGYTHGKALFSAWNKTDLVKQLFREKSAGRLKPHIHKSQFPVEPHFTDLAELICRIDQPLQGEPSVIFEQSDDEYEDIDEEPLFSNSPISSTHSVLAPKHKLLKNRSYSSVCLGSHTSFASTFRKRSSTTESKKNSSSNSSKDSNRNLQK